ncbi:hypothetical protein TNCV_4461901 [Trichonephila clavipes]|nr:hypothetical protein TNCV_4461901 [Trichonephila clavipes]
MRGLAARRLFRVPPCRKVTIHLQTSMSSPGFVPSPYGAAVSVANHYTDWATESNNHNTNTIGFHYLEHLPPAEKKIMPTKPCQMNTKQKKSIRRLETVDLARQINREEERGDVQKLLDSHNQELSSDEHIEMQDQQHDIEELES